MLEGMTSRARARKSERLARARQGVNLERDRRPLRLYCRSKMKKLKNLLDNAVDDSPGPTALEDKQRKKKKLNIDIWDSSEIDPHP